MTDNSLSASPLVSFIVLSFNQENFIREAVQGAFSQDYAPLQIILSDDCSTDRTFEIMQEMAAAYPGPHTVILNRNPHNLGIGGHYNRVMDLASGEIIEIAAGDDISLPWRTADSVAFLLRHPDISCVSMGLQHFNELPAVPPVSREAMVISARWRLDDFVASSGYLVNAPARAFRKFIHDIYGPLLANCPVEDGSCLLRCLLHGDVAACDAIGVLYRWHGANISGPEHIHKIPISDIYEDFLNTVRIAHARDYIDTNALHEMSRVFEAERDRFALLEALRARRFDFVAMSRALASRHFSLTHKVKLFVKWSLRLFFGGARTIS